MIISFLKKEIFIILLLSCFFQSAFPQDIPHGNAAQEKYFGIGGYLGFPLLSQDDVGWAISGRIKLFSFLYIMADLNFYNQYYDYQDGKWVGPLTWGEVNTSVAREDWIFYHTVLVVSLCPAYYWEVYDWLKLYAGAGLSLSFFLSNSVAVGSYPGFAGYFESFAENVWGRSGFVIKLGADFFFLSQSVSLGFEYQIRIQNFKDLDENLAEYGGFYFTDNSYFVLTLIVWF